MECMYIKTEDLNKWVAKYFPNKDLITVDDLLAVIEELDAELENEKEKCEELENNMRDNYRPVSPYTMYGINEKDFC